MSGSISPNQATFSKSQRAITFDEMNALVANKTDMIDGAIASEDFPEAIQHASLIADVALMRAYGAAFDGVTDDGPAFNAIIAAVTAGGIGTTVNSLPAIIFELPAKTVLIGTTIISGSVNVSMRGCGAQNTVLLMKSGGNGIWQHGTQANPSQGYVEIENLMMQDADASASGATALNFYFTAGLVPTIRIDRVRLLHFAQGIYMLNPPRDINVRDLTVYGPDYAMQASPGIVVESTQSGPEVFTTTWDNVNVFNYAWGWRFIGGGMIEGHRFKACTAYNGWGMVQAYVHGDGIVGLTGYQAVIWDFYCCDWQGFGYALDLHNVRGVRVRGGYWTFNDRTTASGTTIAPPWGSRTSAATNAMFDFYNAGDVLMEGMQIDIPSSGTFDDTVIAHFDDGCSHVRIKDNAIYANSKLYGGFELGDTDASSLATNTLKVLENEWLNWVSGDKVIDHGSKQIDLPWLSDNYYGTQTQAGLITLQQQVTVTVQSGTVSSTDTTEIGQIYVAFPTNRYGNNLFKGGAPTVVANVQQALTDSQSPFFLGEVNRAGFYMNTTKNMVGVQVTVPYIAMGW
ncbi:hypothetical protein IGS75_01435 [Gluconobacter sphaericus]|uniref:hypothetical protein n=1 Tax=Gluconobacter sphaericus TaxID=574987 RepID=UPI001924C6A9|nr:hypothetical protein [Gluconobacter sphaericus]QQX91333.1 hypothetical protein IGS75_01435 [Gluconobacter sphaericus]